METKFIIGINLLVAVPTTLRSVKFASYPFSIVRHVVRGKQRKKAGPIKIIHVMLLGTSFVVFVCFYCFVLYAIESYYSIEIHHYLKRVHMYIIVTRKITQVNAGNQRPSNGIDDTSL